MVPTVTRSPRMQGLPPMTAGLWVIRSICMILPLDSRGRLTTPKDRACCDIPGGSDQCGAGQLPFVVYWPSFRDTDNRRHIGSGNPRSGAGGKHRVAGYEENDNISKFM